MSMSAEFRRLADLLLDAAGAIGTGVEGAYADEEDQHPQAKQMRRVERRCRVEALKLLKMAKAAES